MIPKGFRYGGARCGLKNKRNDVGLIVADKPCVAAGLFTTNIVRASSVDYSRQAVSGGTLQAILATSGNANCCTGETGVANTRRMAELAGQALGIDPGSVAVASTGVIGKQLDMGKVEKGIPEAARKLGVDPKPLMEAILTTDLVEKEARAEVRGASVYGVAKGSGMIAPNMATMFAFVTTDLAVEHAALEHALEAANAASFNRMTVDTDTSTNDMVLVMASGASGVEPTDEELTEALTDVLLSLAKQVARDGEGATKLIEVVVRGTDDPVRVARSIADSPLVKTAMFGCDPNWGRIMMAAGKAGVPFDPESATLTVSSALGEHTLYENGTGTGFDPQAVSATLKSDEVRILLDLGPGEEATIYTCDLGYGYVRINAEYHT